MTLPDSLTDNPARRAREDRRRMLLTLALRAGECDDAELAARTRMLAGPGEERLALLRRLAEVAAGPWPTTVEGLARRAEDQDVLLLALVPEPRPTVEVITVDSIPALPALPALRPPGGAQPTHVRILPTGAPEVSS